MKILAFLLISSILLLTANLSKAAEDTVKLSPLFATWGIKDCAKRIDQVSAFVGYRKQAAMMAMAPPAQENQRMLPLAIEVPLETGAAYVSASFAPGQANGCGATYDAVIYWEKVCSKVASKQFADFKAVGKLNQHIDVLDGGVATKVFLMPAGSGCISIKKEVLL